MIQPHKPMKISDLIKEFGLTYPFVIQKVLYNGAPYAGVILGIDTKVTITGRAPAAFGSSDLTYIGYQDKNKYWIPDSPIWKVIEASGNNVLSLSYYAGFRKKSRTAQKSRKKDEGNS